MAFRSFDSNQISRRSLLRGSALLGAGVALSGLPLGRAAMAHVGHWPNVAATVEDYVSSGKVANMVATLGWEQKHPDIIARGTLALGGATEAGFDSLYRIYSMTKPITGMAAMMLVEDGKLTLDQPVADFIPGFANMMVQKEYDGSIGPENLEPLARPVTVRMLMTHTAGLGYGIIQKGPIVKAMGDKGLVPGQISRFPIPGLSRAKPTDSLEKFADGIASLPLVHQPGTRWSYSVGLDILGRVIEVASGMSFESFLETRLFKPCGMDSTWFQVPKAVSARMTTNYGVANGMSLPIDLGANSIFYDNPGFASGGAGLVSSPRDYDQFQRMLVGRGMLDGTRVMSEAAVLEGTSNLLPEGADTAGTWVAGQGFGAGGRSSGGAFGWGGAAGTTGFVDMESRLRAANFTQYMPSDAYSIQREFPDIVMKDLALLKAAAS
uniref:serine hydrolase domain-containing protein n=1 Tax=Parerythrobacter lutipelagi TaxID=1964208 RepID=UPI0010F667FE|nr:serine hydrolase domain-containing protein [Parerythrobacter lutipelagi]